MLASQNLTREPEILEVLAASFGPYPFRDAGAMAHDFRGIGFSLESQTRPIYYGRNLSAEGSTVLLAHELAHQWFGDQVRVDGWQHIWLNEGFGSYAEWLWEEYEYGWPVDQSFEDYYGFLPESDPFWDLTIGDPGPSSLFDFAVYYRGAMTLHQLRRTIGDDAFFATLKEWAAESHTGTTDEFIALAEDISGQDLKAFFQACGWRRIPPPGGGVDRPRG